MFSVTFKAILSTESVRNRERMRECHRFARLDQEGKGLAMHAQTKQKASRKMHILLSSKFIRGFLKSWKTGKQQKKTTADMPVIHAAWITVLAGRNAEVVFFFFQGLLAAAFPKLHIIYDSSHTWQTA